MKLLLAFLLTYTSIAIVALGASLATAANLSAILRLDQEQYETGQPVLAFVALMNKDSQGFKDLAYLDPGAGFLRVHVQGEAGELTEYGYRDTWLFSKEGPELEPSGCACEIFDLLRWFGTHADTLTARDPARIPAGTYKTWAVVKANLGVRAGGDTVVRSNTVVFRIVDSDQRESSPRTRTANIRPETLAKSPNAFVMSKELPEGQMSTEDILKALKSAGRSPTLAAAILNQRIKARIEGDSIKRTWLRALRGVSSEQDVRCVIETWERKLTQRKHYFSYGP